MKRSSKKDELLLFVLLIRYGMRAEAVGSVCIFCDPKRVSDKDLSDRAAPKQLSGFIFVLLQSIPFALWFIGLSREIGRFQQSMATIKVC